MKRLPVIPVPLQKENIRGTVEQAAGLSWHRMRYHGLRSPVYLVVYLSHAVRGAAVLTGRLQSSQISSSGVYVVAHDINLGVWHTNGDGGQTDNECYFATLNRTNTSDIADNNNFDGAETVDLSGVYAFEISGPCTWVRIG